MQIELAPGVTVDMHPASGRDSLIALSVRARMEEHLPEYNITGGFLYQQHFGNIVAQSDAIHGLDFALPHWEVDGEMLAEGFKAWLALPGKIVEAWIAGLQKVEPSLNGKALTPGAVPDSPLPQSPARSKKAEPTTT